MLLVVTVASTDSLKSNVMVGFSTLNDQETRTCKYCVYGTGLLEQFLGEIRLKRRHSLCGKESSLFLGTRRSKPRTALGNNGDNLTINNIKQKLSKLQKKKKKKGKSFVQPDRQQYIEEQRQQALFA